jgi:hypothetical protein
VTFAKSIGKSVAPYLSGSERLLVRALHATRVGG